MNTVTQNAEHARTTPVAANSAAPARVHAHVVPRRATTAPIDQDEAIILINATKAFPALTDREREVALLLADGSRNSEIAEELDISIKTVDTHRAHVLRKLHCRNNVELCKLAIREGYIKA